jgi:signal transduction histidine kinase/DNA-binding response OmpR family regulator
MRLGLYNRLLLIAVLPAALVALTLGIGTGWESVVVTRTAARATAQIEAVGLAHNLVVTGNGHRALPMQILAGNGIIEARLVNSRGDIVSSRTRLDLPLPPRRGWALLLDTLGAPLIHTTDLSARVQVPKMPLRIEVLLSPERWNYTAGRGVALAAAATAAALLLSVLLALLLSSGLTVRLRAVTRQLTRLARGEYGTRLPIHHGGELTNIATDLNCLADTLNRRAREANPLGGDPFDKAHSSAPKAQHKAFDDFLHALDHELRSPLNAIFGYTQLLKAEPLTPSQRENLDIVHNAAQTLAQLLDDSLRQPTKRKRARSKAQAFDLIALIDEIIALNAPAAYAKPLDLIADCGGWRTLPVMGHALYIRQILVNLVGNAVKYTDSGHVCLQLDIVSNTNDKLKLTVHVSDTGPGIPRKQRDQVFKPRERLRSTATLPGKGLGLAISQELAAATGGYIELDEAPGGGCKFSLHLTLAHAEAFAAQPMPSPTRMLLWEPDPSMRSALAHRLCAAGAELDLAPNRDALLARLDTDTHYDVVVFGLAPGETPPELDGKHASLQLLACTLDPSPGAKLPIAPKCIGQQRIEHLLGLHRSTQTKPVQSYLSPRLWRILCEDTPLDLDRLATALRARDITDARAAIHRICGTASFVHMQDSERAARLLEKSLANGEPDLPLAREQLAQLSHTLLEELRRIAPPATQRSLAGWRIMVVDDNRLNAELLARHLESHGATAKQFQNAADALRAPGPWHASLVDVQLEDDDGIALGATLHNNFPHTLIIAQSGDTQASTREHAHRAGFHDYLTKPIDLEQLPQRLLTLRTSAAQIPVLRDTG